MTIDPREIDHSAKSVFYSLSNEMREAILTEIDEHECVEHLYRQVEQREWAQKMRSTAPQILAVLRQYIPNPQIQEVEEFILCRYGRECLGHLLNSEPEAQGSAVGDNFDVGEYEW